MAAHADSVISLGGQDQAALGIRFGSFSLTEVMGGHASFNIECMALDEGDEAHRSGSQASLDRLVQKVGQEMHILVQSPDRETPRHILDFKGLITGIRSERQRGGGYHVFLEGYSKTVLMDLSKGFGYVMSTDTELAYQFRQIAEEFGDLVSLDIPAGLAPDHVMKYDESKFNFLLRMAERAELWCWYDGSRFQITRQLPDETVPLTMGTAANEDALESFGLQSEFSADNFVINAFDPVARSTYMVMGRDVPFSGEFHPWARQMRDQIEASTIYPDVQNAEQRFRSLSETRGYIENEKKAWISNLVRGQGTSSNCDVRVARKVDLAGMGEGYTGQYVVTRVTHTLDVITGHYSNAFECVHAASAQPEWRHRRPKALELCQAEVVEDEGPPWANDHMGQVKVRLHRAGPAMHLWARVLQPYAGKDTGMFFMPELGDEVVVAFLDGNTGMPVVVGSAYNKNESKVFGRLKEIDKNMGKGILTRGGNEILIQDEENKETITISNKDHKNYIKLSLDGGAHISVHTHGHLGITCGSMSIDCSKDMKVKVGGNTDWDNKGYLSLNSEDEFYAFGKSEAAMESDQKTEVGGKQEVRLICGGSEIKLDPSSIAEKASLITLN